MRTALPSKWFRMYAEFATDPKVQMLSETNQRRYIMLLCLRCCNGDVTLHDAEIAFQLRISEEEWEASKALMMGKNLINDNNQPCAWERRQFISDSSAERVSEHRERKKQPCNGDVTLQSRPVEAEADTDKEGKPSPSSVKPMRGKPVSPDAFAQFWASWPKRVGKQAAVKAWAKLNPDSELQQRIAAAVAAQIASEAWQQDGGRYVPDPATWLNGRRWEDEITPAPTAYVADELAVMVGYNAALKSKDWPEAAVTPYSSQRAVLIRAFLEFGKKPGWIEAYFGWLAEKVPGKPGYGFDWAIGKQTYLRAKEGNFAALREGK